MRVIPGLILFVNLFGLQCTLAQPLKTPRLDFNGKPLPEGAVARIGIPRFVTSEGLFPRALSSNGTTLVTASAHPSQKKDMRVEFMSVSTGKIERTLVLSDVTYGKEMQFLLDGNKLTIASDTGVKTFAADTGKLNKAIFFKSTSRSIPWPWSSSNVAVSPDGKWVAHKPGERAEDSLAYVYEMSTGKEVTAISVRSGQCLDLAFSKDGKRLLLKSAVGNDCSKLVVACIDIDKRKIVGEIAVSGDPHEKREGVVLGTDGETVAQRVADGAGISIHHLPTGKEVCVIRVNSDTFTFTPDGASLCAVDKNRRVAVWNTATGVKIRDLEGILANASLTHFGFIGISKDGCAIAAYDEEQMSAPTIVVWNASTGKRVERLIGHEGIVTSIAYVPGTKLLATGGIDNAVRLWNMATGEHLRLLATHDSWIWSLTVSPDGKFLASEGLSGVIRVTNIADGKLLREISGRRRGQGKLVFSQDGTVLFAGDKMLAWQNASANEMTWLKPREEDVLALGVGGTLALTEPLEHVDGKKESIRLLVWNPVKKKSGISFSVGDKNKERLYCTESIFSPNGHMIASGQLEFESTDRVPVYKLGLWEGVSGHMIRTLSMKEAVGGDAADLLAFSLDGRYLASGFSARSSIFRAQGQTGVDVWDVIAGKKVRTLPVLPSCVAFSTDGAQIATGTPGGTILIWDAPKTPAPKKADMPTPAVQEAWWNALGGKADVAYAAINVMMDVPDYAVEFLKERVRPVQLSDPDKTVKLIRQLDSDLFAEREKAQKDLAKLGETAKHHLMKATRGRRERGSAPSHSCVAGKM